MATASRKVGRPALPKEKQRTHQVTVRMSMEELAVITEARHRDRVSEAIRELALKAAKKEAAAKKKTP